MASRMSRSVTPPGPADFPVLAGQRRCLGSRFSGKTAIHLDGRWEMQKYVQVRSIVRIDVDRTGGTTGGAYGEWFANQAAEVSGRDEAALCVLRLR